MLEMYQNVTCKSPQLLQKEITFLKYYLYSIYVFYRNDAGIILQQILLKVSCVLIEGTEKALNFFEAEKSKTVFIGDTLHDYGAAQNTGIHFIGVLTGVCTEKNWKDEQITFVQSVENLI